MATSIFITLGTLYNAYYCSLQYRLNATKDEVIPLLAVSAV